jgi:hypothetical protein
MVLGKADRADRLFGLSWFVAVGLVLLPMAQAYDGVRLFLGSFGFLSVLAGRGAEYIGEILAGKTVSRKNTPLRQVRKWGIQTVLILYSLLSLYSVHPFMLGAYNELAGGIRGAHTLGMETTYWCDSLSKKMLDDINRLPPGLLRPLCMNYDVLYFYKDIGAIKPEIRIDREWEESPDLTPEKADQYSRETPVFDYHLLQCRQGMMGNRNHPLSGWAFYEGRQEPPISVVEKDGVPFFMLFGPARRP